MMAICKGCGKPIQWVEMASGKKMPVDPEPVTDVMIREDKGIVVNQFTPHWATYPNSELRRLQKGEREGGAMKIGMQAVQRICPTIFQ